MALLECKNINLTYHQDGFDQVIFKDLNIRFPSSSLVSIIGESGSGKSSLFNIIASYSKDYEGEVKLGCLKKEIGFVFQNLHLIEHLNVIDNVILPLIIYGNSYRKSYKKGLEALKKVGLANYEKRPINSLSGGQKARVSLARTLVTSSKIILADEPTGSLDSKNSEDIMSLLKEIAKSRLVIVVTHNEDLAFKYSSFVYTIKDYKLVELKKDKESHNSLVEKSNTKYRSIKLFDNIKLNFSFLKNKLVRVLSSLLFTSFCFALILLLIGLSSNIKSSLLDIGKSYYNYNTFTMSFQKEVKLEEEKFSLLKNVKLNEVNIKKIGETTSYSFSYYPSLESFIYPYSSYYYNKVLSKDKVLFNPSFNEGEVIKGRKIKAYNEVVVNSNFVNKANIGIGEYININRSISIITTYFNSSVEDVFYLNLNLKVVGISKEKEVFNNPTIYYSYLDLYNYLSNVKLVNASSAFNFPITMKERLSFLSGDDDYLTNYKSVVYCLNPYEFKEELLSLDSYSISSVPLEMVKSMEDLISSFSKLLIFFLVLSLICSFLLEFVLIENIYSEKKEELAIYLSFHISKSNFIKTGMGLVYIIFISTVLFSYVFQKLSFYLVNRVLASYEINEILTSVDLKVSFILYFLMFIFSYLCGQIPLYNIYKTNLVDSLRGE